MNILKELERKRGEGMVLEFEPDDDSKNGNMNFGIHLIIIVARLTPESIQL